jgi:8-oxo-dGTP diphosphatase
MRGYTKGTTVEGEIQAIREAYARAMSAILSGPDSRQAWQDAETLRSAILQLESETAGFRGYLAKTIQEAGALKLAALAEIMGVTPSRAQQLVKLGREKGNPVTDYGTEPEPPAVALAIIKGPRGVLVERRRDGRPPVTFPGGELLPGESSAAALIRRVPEETGLECTPGELLGRRIHPKTGRVIVYLAAEVPDAEPVLGDPADLAEVLWVSVEETRTLMPDMFTDVRAYLDSQAS